MAEFFGFEINRKGQEKEKPKVSFVPNTDEDGAGVITTGGHFGAYLDLDGDKAKSEVDLIMKYRDIAAQPECDAEVEDIVAFRNTLPSSSFAVMDSGYKLQFDRHNDVNRFVPLNGDTATLR